ncbi:Monofunctional chorismate mutase precursor [Marinomonas spartinae]|uniref:chorismate mutase n=1 Tax=Marinomonas spartinae TaxID=1792290 RepID=A0A1A8TR11_9GAMM|nr:gamma subclass chorismate mutase AroQ [Marinomonas spartinae]SBS29674.1 Monofunctional chorismate mutase precursor [Marinomonas spartinae]SBS36888.1 Monofunctional chorismate mutase precursor [Marinomonas spartinae]
MLKKMLLVTMFVASFSCFATPPTVHTIFVTMNKRLSYMEDVALYKAQHHKAIEDLPREAIVIKKAGESAQQYHLNAHSVERLTKAQISAAKAIQYRYRADLLSKTTKQTPRDLKKGVRPALIKLNNELNRELAAYLKTGYSIQSSDWKRFQATVNNRYLSESDKRMLFNALEKVER